MSPAFRFAARELRGGLGGFRLFLACLTLGVAAIAAVGLVRASVQAGLARDGAAILGGDAAIELTYRFATEEERNWMETVSERVSETVDFRSMAVAGEGRALTQVRAVDGLYPLVGAVELSPEMPLDEAFAGGDGLPGGVMERVLADRMGLKPGDRFQLGRQAFVLSAVLDHYPDSAAAGFAFGPRTLVLTEDLAQAGLIAPGTLFSTDYRLDLPRGADLSDLQALAEAELSGSGLRWRDARAGAPGVAIFVDRLGAFLILAGLSGLAVGGVGIFAAVRAYLAGKVPVIATLKTLGAPRRVVFATYAIQIAALTVIGVALGLALATGAVLGLAPVLEARLPVPAVFAPWARPLAEAAFYGGATALIFALWPLARAQDTRAAALLRDGAEADGRIRLGVLAVIALAVAGLVTVAARLSGSATLTLWTFAGIAGVLIVLAIAAQVVRWLAGRVRPRLRGAPGLRAALAAIETRGGETTSVMLSLGLGLSVLAAVGQIDGTLQRAIKADLPDVAPSYFFVDIQPDQIAGFKARLADDPGVSRVQAAPMLRGIITRINDRPAEEVAGDHWVIQGDRGVTYSATLPDDTTLTEGTWWPDDYSGPPLVSMAQEEAEEIGLKLGDRLTVNILGRDIEAEIASFRVVEFNTAGIGFVLSMNLAALQGAPHSWIATVYAAPDAEGAILRDLSSAYPNITAIRVGDAIERVAGLLGGIASAIRWGAAVTLMTGLLVLIGAGLAGARARLFEAAVLKTVGATRARVLGSLALRSALLGLAAGIIALGAGIAGGWAVARFVMETDYAIIWSNAALVIGIGVAASLGAGLGFAITPLSARPARVLRARD
ncbi:MAG: drug:proton antiporter [Rhodobacterales bacterium]|nr:MAG: drug:proton antiporter [Rhodobacterales bacterium]